MRTLSPIAIAISGSLVEPVKNYQAARRYKTIGQAANELIRVGLEASEKKEEKT